MNVRRLPLYYFPKIVKYCRNIVDVAPKGEPLNFLCLVIDYFSIFYLYRFSRIQENR
jgi:hypothetical protein